MVDLPTLQKLSERVQWARLRKRWRQEDLAKAVDTSRAQIQKIENGTIVRPRNMQKLAEALGVSPIWLEYGDSRLERITPEAADLAIQWMELPEEVRATCKVMIEAAVKKTLKP